MSELCNEIVPHASVRTVKRSLALVNIRKWRAKKRALLKESHASQRLAWVKEHRGWTKEDWEGVIFSDECLVEKSRDPKSIWIFRTPDKKWKKECIQGVTKGPGIKLMVWACI